VERTGFLSDPDDLLADDLLTDGQKTSSRRCEVYSATVPSIDSALSSWDGSGFDAGYGSQGALIIIIIIIIIIICVSPLLVYSVLCSQWHLSSYPGIPAITALPAIINLVLLSL